MKNERSAKGIHVGSASIVMIFAVLCLTVFSTLSFVTAHQESKLAEKAALALQQYYQADWNCETRYEDIARQLQDGVAPEQLQALDVELEQVDGIYYLRYAEPIDENQQLQVCLAVLPEGRLETKQWKVVAVQDWNYDETIEVWDGN
jgi:hypothetical protein